MRNNNSFLNQVLSKIVKIAFLGAVLLGAGQASAASEVCWKSTYGRGVGTVPSTCGPGQEKSGLLCYANAKPGYKNIAGVAWQICPPGWRDDGAFCRDAYSRGTLWLVEKNCHNANKDVGGCEWSYGAWYPKCKPGYATTSASICSRTCPEGMASSAGSCRKNTYIIAPITPQCAPDMEYDTGLCYKKCREQEGYYGVGPVCWKRCPMGMEDCGAMCGKTKMDCAKAIGEQIYAVASFIYTVADTIITGGGFSKLTEIAKKAVVDNMKKIVKNAAKEFAGMSAKQIKDMLKQQDPNLPDAAAQKIAEMEANPDKFNYMDFLTKVDPTGLAAIAKSFKKDICK